MTKAALFSLGLAALLAYPSLVTAQDNSATLAVNEAVLRQANTIVLRQKLADAQVATQKGNTVAAAKMYQESCALAAQIGSGITSETAQAKAGLATTRLALARDAQSRGDLREANTQVAQVLNADPKNPAALAFKAQNDQLLAVNKGKIPSASVMEQLPQIMSQKTESGTLLQDGKILYEAGKLEDAEAKLDEALRMDPDNSGAYYYLNLIKQAKFVRESAQHTVDTQDRMANVEKRWIAPNSRVTDPNRPNPYATNNLIYTGPGRQNIIAKLDRIHLDNVAYDGLPLTEVLRNLTEQTKLRDPDRKGINFIINPNADQSGQAVEAPVGGQFGGIGGPGGFGAERGGAPTIDPATGLPAAPAAGAAGGAAEQVDVGSFQIKLNLTDVRLADVLDAIALVSDHPLKYSIQDFAIVFAAKAAETPALFMRSFKVDPNTFYSGLESVGATSFGGSSSSSGGGGQGGGGGGGGGGQQQSGAVVGVVNPFAGGGQLRNQGQGGGGGGGGGGGQGSGSVLNSTGAGGAGGGGGAQQNQGGINYITTQTSAMTPSQLARQFFTTLGVNLNNPPGKAVFFNDRIGRLFVKATEQDLDTIERAIQTLNEVSPQVHIKARFIEVQQTDSKALGFDWKLGQFNIGGQAVGTGGTSPSLNVPTSAANPIGAFPGSTAAGLIPGSATDQLLTGGLRNSAPAIATVTGILTDPNFQVVLHALEQRGGFETLAEPEVTTTSGRQTQMRATQVITVITGVNFQQGTSATTTTGAGGNGTGN